MKEENELNNNVTITMNNDLSSDVNINIEGIHEQNSNSINNEKVQNIIEPEKLKEENSKKNNIKVIIVSVLLVIVLGCLSVFVFMLLSNYNNPRNRFYVSMANYIKSTNIIEKLNETKTILSKGVNYSIDGTLNVRVNDESLVKGKFNTNFIDNPINKERYYNLNLLNNNEQIIDLKVLNKDNKLHFKLEDIFDKFYYLEDVKYIKNVDTTALINNIFNSLNSYFTKDKFVMTKSIIDLEGKEKKVDKITVKMNQRDIMDLYILIFENISKDNKILNVFVNDNYSLDDIKKTIIDFVDYLKENTDEYDTKDSLIYSLYLSGYEILMQEVTMDNITLKLEGSKSGKISLLYNNIEILKGSYANNYLKFNMNNGTNHVELNITFEDKLSEKEISTNYNIILSADMENTKFKVISSIDLKINNDNIIPDLELYNSKSFDDITEEEANQIIVNIQNISIVKSLVEDYNRRVQNAVSADNVISTESYYSSDFN